MLLRLFVILPVLTVNLAIAQAQGPRKLADKPFVVMYARDINEKSIGTYAAGISKRLGVGKSVIKQIGSQLGKIVTTEAQDPIIGQLFYLVQGIIPSMETISFRSVVDEAEAKEILKARSEMRGNQTTFEELGNGHYKVVMKWEFESELQPDQEVNEYNNESPGRSNKLEVIERDGKRIQVSSGSYTEQYRYQDRFLYSNAAEDFTDVTLPTSQEIFDSLNTNNDVGIRIYADRIPQGLRTMGWSMLSAMVGTQLQLQNSEGEESWKFRQAAGKWGLPLVKSLLFDVDDGEGEGHLASDGKPVRGQLTLTSRRNSAFIKQLDEMGSGRSRFAPLLREDAAASIHLCLALSPEGRETLHAAADWFIAAESANSSVRAAITDVVAPLHEIANGHTLEVIARVAHSRASGSVVLAGLQVGDYSDLLINLERGLRDTMGKELGVDVELTQRHGRPVIQIDIPSTGEDSPVRISHVWIAHREGCLWIAAGGENAHEMIRSSVKRCGDAGRAVRTRWLTTKVDLEQWMSWPKDDPTGLATLPNWLDSAESAQLMALVTSMRTSNPTPLLDKIMALKGSKKAWLTLDGDKSALSIEAELGGPLADWFFARQIDSQERMMEQMRKQQEATVRDAQKAAANPEPTSEE